VVVDPAVTVEADGEEVGVDGVALAAELAVVGVVVAAGAVGCDAGGAAFVGVAAVIRSGILTVHAATAMIRSPIH
jgi:hypothetical protein